MSDSSNMSDTFDRSFPAHDATTAPEAAKGFVAGSAQRFGFLPSPVARLATAPTVAASFMRLVGAFDTTSLNKLEREVVVMTIARWADCHYCIAMHSAMLAAEHTAPEVLAALRAGTPVADARLAALQAFTAAVLAGRGDVTPAAWSGFVAAGFGHQQALEVVLGVAAYVLSTFANRLTQAPLDAAFAPWQV